MSDSKDGVEVFRYDFKGFSKEFLNEGDRAAVVLGASQLDFLLGRALQAALRPSTSNRDDLFDQDGPLATFNAKVLLAHRMNLLTDDFCHALKVLGRIRNDFAHGYESGLSLDSGRQRDRVEELVRPIRLSAGFAFFRQAYSSHGAGSASFRAAVVAMLLGLVHLASTLSPIESSFKAPYDSNFEIGFTKL